MIKLENLTVGYPGHFDTPTKIVRQDLNYEFKDDLVYGMLAQSGGGKSTILKTICGLLKPLKGHVYIDGKEYKTAGENPVFLLPQQYTSFNWINCIDNVLIVERDKSKRKPAEAMQMLKAVGLDGYADCYPSQLSGGMRQRLALARVLYARPKYLLMDEPMSALDDNTRAQMQDLVLKFHQMTKNTVILVTHSPAEAKRMCGSNIISF